MRDELVGQVVAVARCVPGLVSRVVVGGLLGGLLGTVLGGLSLSVPYVLGWSSAEGMTAIVLGGVSVAAAAVGGMIIGALRGCARGLGGLVDELDLVPKLWLLVKPHVLHYASAALSGVHHVEARANALRAFQSEQTTATDRDGGIAQRAERFVAGLLHSALAGGLLRGLLGRGDERWEDVESQGLARATEVVGDLIARLFHGPALSVMLFTVAVAIAPHALRALTVSSFFH